MVDKKHFNRMKCMIVLLGTTNFFILIIKLEKSIMNYESRVNKLIKDQGFKIIAIEDNSLVLYRRDEKKEIDK